MSSRRPSPPDPLEAKLATIADYAKILRDSGVTYLRFGDTVIKLERPETLVITGKGTQEAEYSTLAPLDDPDTFGGKMPTFRRPKRDEDDEEGRELDDDE